MRNGRIGLVSAVVLASTMAAFGCSSSSGGSSSGGSSGSSSGGSTGTGGSSCPTVEPCGGDIVGTWTVSSSCLTVGGELDLTSVGAGCPSRPVGGSIQVTGTWTAKANNTYTDDTKTTGDEQFRLTAPCLIISSTPVSSCDKAAGLLSAGLGYSSLTCNSASGGECDCSAKIDHAGTAGVSSPAPSSGGTYSISGNVLSLSGDSDDVTYSYCVSGSKLTLTPKSAKPTMSGAIVLQKSDSSGSGGSTGSGGQSASGGVTGSGGATGQSGGAGGNSSAGGAPGSGGTNAGGQGGKSAAGGSTGSGGASAAGGSGGASTGKAPCDIYAAANTPCVAAHSVVRALYSAYNDKLYQVRRADNTTKDILPLAAGGIADTAPEDTFCAGSTCVLTVVYDQSGKGNDLWYQGSTQVPASPSSKPANALKDPVTVGGHKVYSVFISPNNCYWHDGSKSGMATGAEPEGMYMVTSSRNANGGCCFDYGNSETDRSADGEGTMDALNFSTTTAWGSGAGPGPWVMADMEYGLFTQTGNTKNPNDPTQTAPFVTAVLKNDGTKEYALRGGDATTGILSTYYKGALPGPKYSPMRKQGALILGCGGDCCKPSGGANASSGIFFEGAIVSGYPTDATEDAVQASILAAGYGK
jgi:hypothetical protein